eukprot:768660-Prymnesium_polylepis.1
MRSCAPWLLFALRVLHGDGRPLLLPPGATPLANNADDEARIVGKVGKLALDSRPLSRRGVRSDCSADAGEMRIFWVAPPPLSNPVQSTTREVIDEIAREVDLAH